MAYVKTFYSGPVTAVSVNGVTYGDCQDVLIKWEATGPETMDKAPVQTGGLGTFEAKAMKIGTGTSGLLKAIVAAGSAINIIVTTPLATYTMSSVNIEYGFSGELNDPNKTTLANLKATKWTATRAAFCVIADV